MFRGAIILSGVFFFITSTAVAYVAPSFYVIRHLAEKHKGFEKGRFQHKITAYKSDGSILSRFHETLLFRDVDSSWVRISDDNGSEVRTVTRKISVPKQNVSERPVLYDLLFIKEESSIFDHFKLLGLPLVSEQELYATRAEGVTGQPYKPETEIIYQRHNNIAVQVIKSDNEDAVLAVFKENPDREDSLLPMRVVFKALNLEFQFEQYQLYKGFRYPAVQKVFRNGLLWAKMETTEVKLGETKADSKIDQDLSGKPKIELDSLNQDFIEQYCRWIR